MGSPAWEQHSQQKETTYSELTTLMGRLTQLVSFASNIIREVRQIQLLCTLLLTISNKEALKSLLIIERSPEPEQEQMAANTPSPAPTVNEDDLTPDMRRKLEEFKKSLVVGIPVFISSRDYTY